jgi:chromosome segregation ATPase|eukprot:COSAG01_NODE_3219_length_6395_cov_28.930930_3_plen_285_part_00
MPVGAVHEPPAVMHSQVQRRLAAQFADAAHGGDSADGDPARMIRELHERMRPLAILSVVRGADSLYRNALERQTLSLLQAERRAEVLDAARRRAEATLDSTKLELQAVKDEWQQMRAQMQATEQRMASMDARNVFLEKADEARRLIHAELRDTQRRLAETRDEHTRIQAQQATTQLDLEQQVQDMRLVQDELEHELRREREGKRALESARGVAQTAATRSIERCGELLEQTQQLEEDRATLDAQLQRERDQHGSLQEQAREWPDLRQRIMREPGVSIVYAVHFD